MSDSKEPRSIRLNKSHKEDILAAVMKRWEETNPFTDRPSIEVLFRGLFAKTKGGKFKHPEVAKRMSLLQKQKELFESVNTQLHSVFLPEAPVNVVVQIGEHEGANFSEVSAYLPYDLAVELGIPVCGKYRDGYHYRINDWKESSYIGEDGQADFATFRTDSMYLLRAFVSNRDPIYTAYKKSKRNYTEWRKERDQVRSEVSDYLDQFNTTKQIRDAWPELVDYLPAHLADPERVINLPALTTSRLNERLGI